MTESITVNGVVFERVDNLAVIYKNGEVWLQRVTGWGWQASVKAKLAGWHETPDAALADLCALANSWTPVLRELARINGGAG